MLYINFALISIQSLIKLTSYFDLFPDDRYFPLRVLAHACGPNGGHWILCAVYACACWYPVPITGGGGWTFV